MMRHLFYFLAFFSLFTSCNDTNKQNDNLKKEEERNLEIFNTISNEWNFIFPQAKPEAETSLKEWNKWQQFKAELEQKPKTSILAFQMKVKNVASKADSLYLTVPEQVNVLQVKSRLITLSTKLNSLDTYIHLERIPEKKIVQLIKDVKEELKGFYKQLDEIFIKKAIPKEIGEDDMIKALDTTRLATKKFQEEKETLQLEEAYD